MVNLREARRLLAGTKKPEQPVKETKIELKTTLAAAGAGRSVLNSMVQAQASERLMANLDDWVINGEAWPTPPLTVRGFDLADGPDTSVVTLRNSSNGAIEGLRELVRSIDSRRCSWRTSGRTPNDANLPFPSLNRDGLHSRIAMTIPTAEETATQVQLRQAERLARLYNQFATKSDGALRREGVAAGGPGVRPRDLVPSATDIDRFLRRDGGPDHVEEIIAVVYWGYGDRRICMMECRMDVYNSHRGTDTNLALLAFKVRDTQNFGIQPFCGSQNYNETVGFFIYQAQQGGRL